MYIYCKYLFLFFKNYSKLIVTVANFPGPALLKTYIINYKIAAFF